MEITYQSEREVHGLVVTNTVTFVGELDEWRELVTFMRSHTAAAMLKSVENVCAQFEGENECPGQ